MESLPPHPCCIWSTLQVGEHRQLEGGVITHSVEQCWNDYRLLTLNRLFRMVFVIGGGNISDGPYRMFLKTYFPFCVAAILDLDAGELLPE